MAFDMFAMFQQPGREITVHNVRLINVEPADNGQERLIVEYKGTQHELLGAGPWDERHSRQDVGSVGHLVPKRDRNQPLKTRSYYFRTYLDPSLRRVPELDTVTAGGGPNSRGLVVHHGWCCDAIPEGFRAPAGLIPGDRGKFVPDRTIEITVRVPPEFIREARRVQLSPRALLESFVGDLAGVRNSFECPRADGYTSNGSDERNCAEAWLERAHGMQAIDPDEFERQQEHDELREILRDDIETLLLQHEYTGGNPQEVLAAVQRIVEGNSVDTDAADET